VLACLGAAGLLIDWVYFGRFGRTARRSPGTAGVRSVSIPLAVSLPQRLRRKFGVAEKVGRI